MHMKRLIPIIACLLVIFAGVSSALAICEQISFVSNNHRHASAADDHHHADSPYEHSGGARIHCPTVDPYVPTAISSAKPDRGPERLENRIEAESAYHVSDRQFHRLIHDPPAITGLGGISSHLFLSVLRI